MISYYLEVVFLSIVQGVSEFIPISSSAHLIILSKLGHFSSKSLEIDVSLHLGSLLAIIFYFSKDLILIFKNKKLLYLILFGSLPLILFGSLIYYFEIVYVLRNLEIIAWSSLIFGILLFISDKKEEVRTFRKDISLKRIFVIGLFQILALVPGASRSGIVITAGRFLKFNRVDCAKISFFLSIPALASASILGLKEFIYNDANLDTTIFLSIIFSFIFSYLTIKFLLIYLKKFNLNVFVYYRIVLSLIIFFIIYY
tara:strand:+ start:172 stop:939 length:768 start_codon:yes stop_codon:yes gene_type:complete